jgi:tetratricopeptide (TPR) repeat protein
MSLADANKRLRLHEEGILQAKQSLEICEWLDSVLGQARSLQALALLLEGDNQLNAAEEAASRSIDLLPDSEQFIICQGHCVPGSIYHSMGEAQKAINHFETALGIADSFNWHTEQFWTHYSLAWLFRDQGRFDEAHAHIERAKSHTVNDAYRPDRTTELWACIWYHQGKLAEAKFKALRAVVVLEKLGAVMDVEVCRNLLWRAPRFLWAHRSHRYQQARLSSIVRLLIVLTAYLYLRSKDGLSYTR